MTVSPYYWPNQSLLNGGFIIIGVSWVVRFSGLHAALAFFFGYISGTKFQATFLLLSHAFIELGYFILYMLGDVHPPL